MRHSAELGFSLVELMVALVIGLLVLLGASQLYLTLRQNLNRAEALGERQDTLLFASSTLLRDIRAAKDITVEEAGDPSRPTLTLTLDGARRGDYCADDSSDDFELDYFLAGGDGGTTGDLKVAPDCADEQALVSGLAAFDPTLIAAGRGVDITLRFPALAPGGNEESLTFTAMSRRRVFEANASSEAGS